MMNQLSPAALAAITKGSRFNKAATPSDFYRTPLLDNVSMAAFQDPGLFVATKWFPTVPVTDEQFKYYTFDMNSISMNKPDQSLMFDSSTYTAKDAAAAVSNVLEWSVDVVRSASNIAPVSTAIARLDREMARVMNAEWLLLGGADSGGAYSMHADKTAMFGLSINSALDDIADDARRDLATRLVKLNGLDPETCTPILAHDPIATASVLDACRALAALATAGLHPKDEAFDVIRSRLELPPQPEIDDADWMLPRGVVVVPDSDPTLATPDGAGASQAKPVTAKPGKPAPGAPTAAAPGQPGNVHAQTKRRRR